MYPAPGGDILIVGAVGSHGYVALQTAQCALRPQVYSLDAQHMLKVLKLKPVHTHRHTYRHSTLEFAIEPKISISSCT